MVEAARSRGHDLRITHAVVRDVSSARSWADAHDLDLLPNLDAALADPQIDAIVLATPNSQHVEQVVQCARAGRPVYSEKPLGLNLADARRAIDACAEAGVVLGLGTDRRMLPAVQRLAALVAEDQLGDALQIEAQYSNNNMSRGLSGTWRSSPAETPGGGMTGPGLHALDGLINLGGPIAHLSGQLAHPTGSNGPIDSASLLGTFTSGATFTLGCVRGTPDYFRLAYYGTRGWGEVRNYGELLYRTADDELHTGSWPPELAIANLLDAFARAVRDAVPFPVTSESMLATVAAFEASVRGFDSPGALIEVEQP